MNGAASGWHLSDSNAGLTGRPGKYWFIVSQKLSRHDDWESEYYNAGWCVV